MLEQLRALQDSAGDLHDAHLFAEVIVHAAGRGAAGHGERLARAVVRGDLEEAAHAQRDNPMPGIFAVAARLRERQEETFERLRRDWLEGKAEMVVAQLRIIADALRQRGGMTEPGV